MSSGTRPDMLRIEFDDAPLQDMLQRLSELLTDPRPMMEEIGVQLESNTALRFQLKQDPDGQPWAPWAPSTEAAYARADKGTRRGSMLDRSPSGMRSTLVSQWLSGGGSGGAIEVGFNSKVGPWDLATLHELGTRNMPRRGLLWGDPWRGRLGKGDREDVLDILNDWLARAAG